MAALDEYIQDPRFNQIFHLPADPANGRPGPFQVKYADYGYRNEAHPEQENVLLYFAPLFGSRLIHIAKDKMAKERKIRIISPDRPGFGGTDAADPKERMGLWLQVIPALLRHLGIQHVSLGCHSGGTIYALDMLLHHPEFLHPSRPYIAIAAPWILPLHTTSVALSVVKSLPAGMIGSFDNIASLFINYIGPSVGLSSGLSQMLVSKFTPASTPAESEGGSDSADAKFEEELGTKIIRSIGAEGIQGVSSDAVLLMQKVDGMAGWSDWGDYDVLVPRLTDALRAAGKRLSVDVFYAENDFLIGNGNSKGPQWFDSCWQAQNGTGLIDYHSTTVKGSDHDRIWDIRCGVARQVFERIGQPVEESPSNVSE